VALDGHLRRIGGFPIVSEDKANSASRARMEPRRRPFGDFLGTEREALDQRGMGHRRGQQRGREDREGSLDELQPADRSMSLARFVLSPGKKRTGTRLGVAER
jgi:hypothetical protein